MSRGLVVLRLLSLSLLGLVACNDPGVDPDDPGDVEFEPLCGQDGPLELMALVADEEVLSVRRIDDGDEIQVRVRAEDPPEASLEIRRNVVIDECGGVIAEVASAAHSLRRRDDVLLGCIDDDLVWLTGYDDPSPSVLARMGCNERQVGDRWVTRDTASESEIGRIVTIETEGSTVRVRELVDAASVLRASASGGVDGKILVQTPELAVYRVDAETGARTLLLEQAAEGKWTMNGDAIAYQRPSLDPDEPSPLILRDPRTGAEQTVDPGFPVLSFGWSGEGVLGTSGALIGDVQWFRLDPLRALALPEGTDLLMVRDDGSFWLQRRDFTLGTYELLTWREGEAPRSELVFAPAVLVSTSRTDTYLDVRVELDEAEHDEVWRLDPAGGRPRMVGNSFIGGIVLDEDRVLTVLVDEDLQQGPLLLIDEASESEVTLVPRVDPFSIWFTLGFAAPGEIVYEEEHDDGTSSLARARLAS